MAGQTEFLQAIQELERLGETNGNQLSMEEINSYFSDMKLEEKQLDFICNLLKKKKKNVFDERFGFLLKHKIVSKKEYNNVKAYFFRGQSTYP